MTFEEKKEDFLKSYFDSFKQIFPELTEEEFLGYYDEDIYGGYPEEIGGSVWESEGKNIYVLIRLLKPKTILELGNFHGKSTNHILQAVEKNGFGEVTLVDIEDLLEYENLHNINFNRIVSDSHKFLNQEINFDLIFIDDFHSYEHVLEELRLIKLNNLNKNYVIWGHDYYVNDFTPNSTCQVRKAFDEKRDEFDTFLPMLDSVSNCGLIICKFK